MYSAKAAAIESPPIGTPTPIGAQTGQIRDQQVAGPEKKRLGEYLIEAGLITQEQLEEALNVSKQAKIPIGSTLVRLNYITIDQLRGTLSGQKDLTA